MLFDILPIIITLIALVIASKSDLKKREVADYLNFSMIALGFLFSAIKTVAEADVWYLFFSFLGFGIGWALGSLMFYTGQWGGGDAKNLMGLGALFGTFTPLFFEPNLLTGFLAYTTVPTWLSFLFSYNVHFLLILFVNILITGAFYGLFWILVLMIKNRKAFLVQVKKTYKQKGFLYYRIVVAVVLVLGIILGLTVKSFYIQALAIMIPGFLIVFGLAFLMTKAIEKVCMIQDMKLEDLTEGEWIAKDVYVGKTYICGPKDLGISNEQIALLKKHKIKSVIVKIGVPFIPAFLIGFLITLIHGSLLTFFFLL